MASERFKELPKPIRREDLIATVDTRPVPDPDGDRDPNTDFVIRYGFGI